MLGTGRIFSKVLSTRDIQSEASKASFNLEIYIEKECLRNQILVSIETLRCKKAVIIYDMLKI